MTGKTAILAEIGSWLDGYLRIHEVPDHPNALNGLEVESSGTIKRLVAAVDASQSTINTIVSRGEAPGTLLLVHHGLFWDGNQPVTGRHYRRLRALLQHDIALYSAHIPLDLHPEVGNNVLLAQALGLTVSGWFGEYKGVPIGVRGTLDMGREALAARLGTLLHCKPHLIPGGPDRSTRVGIVTGAGGGMIPEARAAGCDTFITGEGSHHTHFDAMEWGLNVVYAGHYATETLGVKALAERVGREFGLAWEFHDHPTGL